MSVRAYKVEKKILSEQATFNMWHDDKIIDFLITEGDYNPENFSENGGTMELSLETLEKMLEPVYMSKLELEDYQVQAIKSDIAFAKAHKDDYVLYECY